MRSPARDAEFNELVAQAERYSNDLDQLESYLADLWLKKCADH